MANVLDTSYTFDVGGVVYSFTTMLLDLPVGDPWDCLDVDGTDMPFILLYEEVESSRGAPWAYVDGDNDLVLTSDDGVLTSLKIDLPITSKFTIQTSFKPSALPTDLSQLDKYLFFIGAYDQQDNAGGILISQTGIALVASFGIQAFILPGSQDLFEEGEEYHTLRIVVDGDQNVMHVYVTKTDDLPTTGHVLRYTSPAPVTPEAVPDSFQIQVIGQATKAITGKFDTLRCSCTQALIPNQRPIADPGADQTANIGSAVTHDGNESFDPEGEPLTYDWRLIDAPDGSRFKSEGTGGSTVDDGDADGFTTIFNGGTDAFSEEAMPLLQPGDHLIISGVLYEVAEDRWVFNGTTGKWDRDVGGAWDDDEIVVVPDTIPDNLTAAAYAVLHSQTYFSSREAAAPSGIADIAGVYTVELVVNDGELDSLPAEALLNIADTSVVLGCIPDVGFIWDHIGDFWNLVEDREKIETVWGGFAQACAAQLLNAWQVDYNKSLLDIQRVFQRRWLDYSTLLEEPSSEDATIRILRGPIFTGDLAGGVNVSGETLQLQLDGGDVDTITFSGVDPLNASQIAQQINTALGYTHQMRPSQPVNITGVSAGVCSADTLPGTGTLQYTAVGTLLAWTAPDDVGPGAAVNVGAGGNFTLLSNNGMSLSVSTVAVSLSATDQVDSITVEPETVRTLAIPVSEGTGRYVRMDYSMLLRVRPGGSANTDLGFSATDYEQNDLKGLSGSAVATDKLTAFRADFLGSGVAYTEQPDLDFDSLGVTRQDVLVKDEIGYGVQKTALHDVDPSPAQLLERRGLTLSAELPDVTDEAWLVPSVVVSAELDFSESLVQPKDLVWFEVQPSTGGPPVAVYCEVVGVYEGRVGFDPLPLLEKYAGVPSAWTTAFMGIKYTQSIPVDELVLEVPRLQEIIKNPPSVLNQNIDYTVGELLGGQAIKFKDGLFSLADPPPDTLWAEVTYLDNNPTIEANFGRLVNLEVADLATRTDDLDYLSAVRGLWWAYFGGPAIERVQTGVQILLGLPFAEAEGVVEDLDLNFSAVEGRLTMRDTADESIVRTYFFPNSVGLAVNELTGETIAIGDTVSQFAPLSDGVEVKDYINDPFWMSRYVNQGKRLEINKFFTFLVRADVDTFNLTNLVFAIDFVKKIRPHYTYPMFVMLKVLDPDQINVQDSMTMRVTLSLFDTFCYQEEGAYRYDDTDESGNWNHAYDATPPPPRFLFDTHRLCPDDFVWAHISFALAGGGAGWPFDTIWAYDDGGGTDILPLSGPDSSPPAPYGPLVGQIAYDDAAVAAGTYHRERELK